MTPTIRRGTLLLVLTAAVLAGPLAAPKPVAFAEAQHGAGAGVPVALAAPIEVAAAEGPGSARRTAVASAVRTLAVDAVGLGAAREFPLRGPFNWGQSEARYGSGRSGHVHEGQDVFGRIGTPLVSVADGEVVDAGSDGGRGNYVAIFDPAAKHTYVYLHMNAPAAVSHGPVRAGQRVGALGCSGSCFGAHLHFEIRRGRGVEGMPTDPLPALRRWAKSSDARATLPPGAS